MYEVLLRRKGAISSIHNALYGLTGIKLARALPPKSAKDPRGQEILVTIYKIIAKCPKYSPILMNQTFMRVAVKIHMFF
jgi:hypothetical protein